MLPVTIGSKAKTVAMNWEIMMVDLNKRCEYDGKLAM